MTNLFYNDKKNLKNIAYETLKKAIINNELKPGVHLSEPLIAKALDMSRTPIREALKFLEKDGLVEQKDIGIFVKQMTKKELAEIFSVRAALECEALKTALINISDQEIDEIEIKWLSLRKNVEDGQKIDENIIIDNDIEFHSFITRKSYNDFLIDILSSISNRSTRYIRASMLDLGNIFNTIDQHLELINVIRERNIEKASVLFYNHIKSALHRLSKAL